MMQLTLLLFGEHKYPGYTKSIEFLFAENQEATNCLASPQTQVRQSESGCASGVLRARLVELGEVLIGGTTQPDQLEYLDAAYNKLQRITGHAGGPSLWLSKIAEASESAVPLAIVVLKLLNLYAHMHSKPVVFEVIRTCQIDVLWRCIHSSAYI